MSSADSQPPGTRSESTDVLARSTIGAAILALAGLLGRAAGLLTTVLVTHFLSKAEYGHANLALIVATIANMASLLSPQQALLTRQTQFLEAAGLAQTWSVWSGVGISSLLVLIGRPLLTAFGQPETTPLLYVYCAAIVLERIAVIPAIELRYRLRFADVARVEVTGDAGYVTVTVAAALLGAGPLCLPLGMVARQGARLLILARLLGQRLLPPLPRPFGAKQRALAEEILRFSLPVHLGTLGEFATLYLDNVFVGALYHAAAQGLYAVGYAVVMTPADTIARYGADAMIRALVIPDPAVRQRTFLQGLRYLSLPLFPVGVGAAAVAETLEAALLPAHWHGIAPLIIGLSAAAMTLGCFQMVFAYLTALNLPRLGGLLPGIRLGAFLLGLFLVACLDPQRQHLPAVAWAVSGAFVSATLFVLWLSTQPEGLQLAQVAVALGPPLIGSAVMGSGLWLLRRGLTDLGVRPSLLCLLVEIGAGVLLYTAYLRLAHRALWAEASAWLRSRLGRARSR